VVFRSDRGRLDGLKAIRMKICLSLWFCNGEDTDTCLSKTRLRQTWACMTQGWR
jgi:hypothetical protein